MTEPTPRTEAVNLVGECRMVGGHTHAFNGPHRFNEAQARAEGLDVEVLARALQAKRGGRMSDNRGWAKDIAARYRAILTGDGMTRDRVTEEVAQLVFARDGGCMAPRLGGSRNDSWGRDRLEHVKDEPRMGRRAPSDPAHLVVLCAGHTEDGMRGGYVWATDRKNREAMRDYLEQVTA